jgi:murein L,D-transpeptidase YcbB/YkuD
VVGEERGQMLVTRTVHLFLIGLLTLLSPAHAGDEYPNGYVVDYPLPPTPPAAPELHIVVDKSEYTLTLFEDDTPIQHHRVIVGRDGRTPSMTTFAGAVILNPEWIVPEPLTPELVRIIQQQEDPIAYLQWRGFLPFRNNEVLDLDAIDWASLPTEGPYDFMIKQQVGPNNFIGQVLIVTDQDGYIQLHDTPDRHLFGEAIREFSAGCIRVEDIELLAAALIQRPVNRIIQSGKTAPFRLTTPIRVDIVD